MILVVIYIYIYMGAKVFSGKMGGAIANVFFGEYSYRTPARHLVCMLLVAVCIFLINKPPLKVISHFLMRDIKGVLVC